MLGLHWCMVFFSSCQEWGYSGCGTQASHRHAFSCWGARALGRRGFNSCR